MGVSGRVSSGAPVVTLTWCHGRAQSHDPAPTHSAQTGNTEKRNVGSDTISALPHLLTKPLLFIASCITKQETLPTIYCGNGVSSALNKDVTTMKCENSICLLDIIRWMFADIDCVCQLLIRLEK